MSYVRRAAAVTLGAVFLVTLLASLAYVKLNDTLMDPQFYPDRLKTDDVYRFVMVDVLTSAFDEARGADATQLGGSLGQNPLVTSGLSTRQITEAVHRALSPQGLERLMHPVVLQIGEYVTGEGDRVVVKIDAGEQIRGVVDEIHKLMWDSDAYAPLIEHEVEPRVRDAAADMLGANENVSGWMLYLFGNSEDAEDRIVRVVMSALTADWVAGQIEQAMDELITYVVGESDGFEIRARLTDEQVETAVEETKSILLEADAYELVYPGVVEPVLADVLGPGIRLPDGTTATREDVIDALRQAAPPSWVQQEAEALIDHMGPYVVGRSDGFSTEIDLSGNKREAAAVLGESALAPIPDSITFTESQFRSALEQTGGPETLELLDSLRTVFREGWSYNQDDLRADLSDSGDALHALDGVRSFFTDGYSHTYQASSGRRSNDRFAASLDRSRARLETVNRYEWPAYLSALALLVVISLLGGTTWRSRLLWASSTVLISAALVYVLSWPMQEPLANVAAEQARAEVRVRTDGPFGGTMQLIVTKVGEVAASAAEDIVEGVRLYSLALAGITAVTLTAAVFWEQITGVVKRVQRRPNLPPDSALR